MGELRKPKHGKGLIRNGALPGTNKGGTGRPPSEIRARLRGSFDQRVAILEEIADSKEQSPADRMKAVDILAKYGLGTTKELTVEHVRDRLQEQIRRIHEAYPPAEAEAILAIIEPAWR